MYKNARPLELAKWQYHFEDGSREAVLDTLACYQNTDGGFGYGLEPDYWNPHSSPSQTYEATEIIWEIGMEREDADHPVIQGILEYLSSGKEFEDNSWAHTIDTNNNYPHADWWHYPYASWWEDTPANRFSTDYNPTAGLAGFILYFEDPDTDFYDLAKEVATEAINQFLMIKDCKKMATVWFEALKKVLASSETVFSPEIVRYKTLEDGDSLALHIFKPRNMQAGEKRPAIVYFFGGGWKLGTPIQFYRECAYYASKGMVAVSVDYRIGYLHHSTPFESFEDAKDAICWLRSHASDYQLDPDKIAVAGGSAGGHLAAALGTIGSDETVPAGYRPNLSVLYYPVVDMVSRGYGFPEIKRDFEKISPIHHVSEATPSTLILLGTKDPIVSVETIEAYQDKLLQKGVDCELHLFEGAGHPIFLYRKPLTEEYYKVRKLTDDFLKRQGFL